MEDGSEDKIAHSHAEGSSHAEEFPCDPEISESEPLPENPANISDGLFSPRASVTTPRTEEDVPLTPTKHPTTQTVVDVTDKSDSRRKFRIVGLKHPGEWRRNEKLWDIISRACQFHVWFDPPSKKENVKLGGISVTYETLEQARLAFTEAHRIILDGQPIKLQASKSFYDPVRNVSRVFPPMEDEELAERTIYVLNLTCGADENLISSILEEGMIESVEIIPQSVVKQQAQVRLFNMEQAIVAKREIEGFELNPDFVLRALSASEYVEWAERVSKPQPFTVSAHPPTPVSHPPLTSHEAQRRVSQPAATTPVVQPQEDIREEDVVHFLMEHIENTKLNWAELHEETDLYELIDQISSVHGGLPDSMLKPALLTVLQKHLSKTDVHWMRGHIEGLIKKWKHEVRKEGLVERPTRVLLQAPVYVPVPADKRKRPRANRAAALKEQLGVAAVLKTARTKFATEDGELDIDEDEQGNILIGGTNLSFDSWAKLNKVSDKVEKKKEEEKVEKKEENRKVKRAKLEEKRKEAKMEKELEEGEMESDEDRRGGSSSGTSNSTSSSSSSSDENDVADARKRRRNRRKADRRKLPSLPPLFQKIFDNRFTIIAGLSMEHRMAFAEILTQITAKKGGFSDSQQAQMMTYMTNILDPNTLR